jgi:predicted fused transcriptional regulator/phosphomethylpyrimidine kinase
MNRRPVTSSNIASIGWEDDTLEVEFVSGHIYAYEGVPEAKYQAALGASSPGKFIASEIIGTHDHRRLK